MPQAQMNNVVQNKVLFRRRFKQPNVRLYPESTHLESYLKALFHRHSVIKGGIIPRSDDKPV